MHDCGIKCQLHGSRSRDRRCRKQLSFGDTIAHKFTLKRWFPFTRLITPEKKTAFHKLQKRRKCWLVVHDFPRYSSAGQACNQQNPKLACRGDYVLLQRARICDVKLMPQQIWHESWHQRCRHQGHLDVQNLQPQRAYERHDTLLKQVFE